MRRRTKWLTLTICLVVLLAATGVAFVWNWLHSPIENLPAGMAYEVPRGASLGVIARDLHQRGWLKYPHVWRAWVRYRGLAGNIKAGEYAFRPNVSPDGLLQLFTSGAVILHSVTFVEGTTLKDLRKTLAQRDDLRHTTRELSNEALARRLKLAESNPEGWFFPDTYQYPKNTSDLEILSIALKRMQQELDAAWAMRAQDLPYKTPYDALIMASIVEKESALNSERALIAGVFIERLARGMKLQTDPTVIYGLGSGYDGNLHKDDLLRDSPYNTYTREGLPPTPICLPSAESLHAALNPNRSGALYFVATGKGDGSHYFSRTLDEHNLAVQRYLRALHANTR